MGPQSECDCTRQCTAIETLCNTPKPDQKPSLQLWGALKMEKDKSVKWVQSSQATSASLMANPPKDGHGLDTPKHPNALKASQ